MKIGERIINTNHRCWSPISLCFCICHVKSNDYFCFGDNRVLPPSIWSLEATSPRLHHRRLLQLFVKRRRNNLLMELFMEKLKQLIYNDDYPLISNHLPSISPVRPLLRLLYEELHSTIRILFTENENHLHELEEVTDLKKRFKEVAEEAHDKVDLFVSLINLRHEKSFPSRCNDFELSLDLKDIMESIKSIKKELNRFPNNIKTDSYVKTRSPAPVGSRISLRSRSEEVVGLDDDCKLIVEKLIEDEKRLDVVSIVGMGGIGKTTLATKVFNDPFVVYHFSPRAWVTVSQNYEKEDLLIEILESIGIKVEPKKYVYSKLREMLHKSLMGKRFLIVVDDIWNTKAWDDLRVFFTDNHAGSRILLTSRLKEVGLHAKRNGLIHELKSLSVEESWELLRKKVFHEKDCPESLIKYGIQIAKGCHGLPLSLVVIAGVLAKEVTDSWERIAQNVTSYIVSDPSRHIQTLTLSIDHLPHHLKDCFLYLGGFPEDYKFHVRRLIWLLVAEGFIQEGANQSLEGTAKDYLMELVDRNLVVVQSRKFNGDIKTCSIHDVLRELCLEIATKKRLFLKDKRSSDLVVVPNKTRRVFMDHLIGIGNNTQIRSLVCFDSGRWQLPVSQYLHSWMLLTVLDLQQCFLIYIPEELSLLVHLRYFAFWNYISALPATICNLYNLQTLIIEGSVIQSLSLPKTISNLVNLRHLWYRGTIFFHPIQKPMNLQTISNMVVMGDGSKSWVKYFPSVKKVSCLIYPDMETDFKSLTSLETLNVSSTELKYLQNFQRKNLMFPELLKKLTLKGCGLPWICMSKIQSLPKLEVLILLRDAFVGPHWEVGEEPFQQLKFLKLSKLGIKQWIASSINFPCLEQLVLEKCEDLEEVPMEIGYIPTLELIKVIYHCNELVVQSVEEIENEQRADGNVDIKFDITKKENFYFSDIEDYKGR